MFDRKAFMKAAFQPRLAEVELAGLAAFFPPGSRPLWTVRNLTGDELAKSMEAVSRQKSIDTLVKALSSQAGQIEEVRAALGISDDVSAELAKRIEQLMLASVSPTVDRPLAVRLAEYFPVEFYQLTNKIVELTGLGADVKKSPGCGAPTASATE